MGASQPDLLAQLAAKTKGYDITIGEGSGTPSSALAWRTSETGEPAGPPSVGSHRVGHDRRDLAAAAAADITKET